MEREYPYTALYERIIPYTEWFGKWISLRYTVKNENVVKRSYVEREDLYTILHKSIMSLGYAILHRRTISLYGTLWKETFFSLHCMK
jgi:hypothetical protein